jgi:uncharacterized membrane-anchored protein
MEYLVKNCRSRTSTRAKKDGPEFQVTGLPGLTLLFEDGDHAGAVHEALANETHEGRVWSARHLLSKEAEQKIWDGNAVWLTVEEMRELLDGDVPETVRATVLTKYRERDLQFSRLFGKSPRDALVDSDAHNGPDVKP